MGKLSMTSLFGCPLFDRIRNGHAEERDVGRMGCGREVLTIIMQTRLCNDTPKSSHVSSVSGKLSQEVPFSCPSGRPDGSENKGFCHQAWVWSLAPSSCPLVCIQAPWHIHACIQIYIHAIRSPSAENFLGGLLYFLDKHPQERSSVLGLITSLQTWVSPTKPSIALEPTLESPS